jgi:hypothetical protein
MVLYISFSFVSCATTRHFNISLRNTLSIFLLNDKKGPFFAIPVQYIGDYHIENFEFDGGYISVGDYKILLKRDNINIDAFVNESSDESGNTDGIHAMVYSERNGQILTSKMHEPLTLNQEHDNLLNQYNIFIEYPLKNNEMDYIINECKKGNKDSMFFLEYTITIDNERMEGCGYLDNFELYDGPVQETQSDWFPPNLGFFVQHYGIK